MSKVKNKEEDKNRVKKSKAEVARILGISRSAITQNVRSGILIAEPDGQIDMEKNREYIERKLRTINERIDKHKEKLSKEKVFEESPESVPLDLEKMATSYDEARIKFTELKSQKARIELDKLRGDLVDTEDVKKAAFDIARKTRDRILAVPDRLSNLLATESDPHKVRELLDEELRRAMEDLQG